MKYLYTIPLMALIACSSNPTGENQESGTSSESTSNVPKSSATLPIVKPSSSSGTSTTTGKSSAAQPSNVQSSSSDDESYSSEAISSDNVSSSSKARSSNSTSSAASSSSKVLSSSSNTTSFEKVVIGTQTWMAKNSSLTPTSGNSWCYDNDPANCNLYGRLYDWEAAQTACPAGWHLPTDDEWTSLINTAGGVDNAGKALRSKTGWRTGMGEIPGTDTYGFSALPGGYSRSNGFVYSTKQGVWWTATELDATYAYCQFMDFNLSSVSRWDFSKDYGFSVRCVQD